MNLFARGLGGFISDLCNRYIGMRGRIVAQTVMLLGEGAMVLVFASTKTLAAAIVTLVIFSLFVQAAEGTSFGIVPYVDPPSTGSISGIVGAGGNVGAVCFGLGFRQLPYKQAFFVMGFTILGSSVLSLFIKIKGYAALLYGKDEISSKNAMLTVPEADRAGKEEVNA
jgi:NNP family nitrate/nitrite transporter-like MFS transporter